MITLLGDLLSAIEDFALYVAAGAEEVINGLFSVIESAVTAATAILPSLPAEPGLPAYVGAINWFFPVGVFVGILVTLVAAYVIWLGVAWLFRKAGDA